MIAWLNRLIIVVFLFLSSHIYADNIESMIHNLIMNKLDNNISELALNFDQKSKALMNSLQNKIIKNAQLTYFAPNYSSFRVNVTTDDGKLFDLFGRYTAYIDIPITIRSLLAGNIITDSDITTTRTPYSRVNTGYITSVGDIIGMQLKRSLASGVLIKHSDVIKQQVIHAGDNVSIVYERGAIKLRTNGVAVQHGAIGDRVKIKNESTGTIVYGVVKSRNLVEVGGEE